MPDLQVLHDDYGDAITIDADGIASGMPALLVTFYNSPLTGEPCICMRLSGERLAAFTEALDRHAAHLAALTEGNDHE